MQVERANAGVSGSTDPRQRSDLGNKGLEVAWQIEQAPGTKRWRKGQGGRDREKRGKGGDTETHNNTDWERHREIEGGRQRRQVRGMHTQRCRQKEDLGSLRKSKRQTHRREE